MPPTLAISNARLKRLCMYLALAIVLQLPACASIQQRPSQESIQSYRELNQQALRSFSAGKYEQAKQIWLSALKKDPSSFKAYHNLGLSFLALEEFAKAEQAFTRALEIEEDFASALVNRAWARSQQGHWQSAWQDLKQAADIKPGDPVINFNRGLIAAQYKSCAAALPYYTRAIEVRPKMGMA